MNRIQQILSKAERDGTARRMVAVDNTDDRAASPPAPYAPAAVIERPEAPEAPAPRALRDRPLESRTRAPAAAEPQETIEATLDPVLVAALAPFAPAAEQYRALRARISQAENGHALRVVQITSPGKSEGKTITALNLALTMAQEFQRRVLVIDADLRQPRIHELLGLPPGPGLVDVLTGASALEAALVEIPEHHLTVLRAGCTYERPAEMLGSGPMRRLIDTLRTQFDRIVVDSAPTIVADPGALAPLVDSLLLVVRAGSTTKPAIARSIGTLASSKLLGLVFNESRLPVQGEYAASA